MARKYACFNDDQTRSITDSAGNTTSYAYDGEGRLMIEITAFGSRSYGYDEVDNRVDMIDRNGRAIHYSIDNLNRVTAEEWINSPNSQKFIYSYDKNSNLVSADDGKIKYEYSYEERDLVEKFDRLSAGQPTVSFAYRYDNVGNLTETKETVGGTLTATTSYKYDDLRYYNTQIFQSGIGLSDKRVDFVYAADSGLMQEVDRYLGNQLIVKTVNSYDEFGRLTGIVHENNTGVISTHGYDYDDLNRLTAESRDGVSRSFAYDKIDEVKSVSGSNTESYTYDKNGNRLNAGYQHTDQNRLTTDGVYSYDYDNEGNRTKRTEIATGKVDEYTWDYRNRLTGVVNKNVYGVVTQTVSYEYDVNDLRVSKNVDGSVEKYFLDGDNIAFVTDGAGKQTFHYLYGMEADQVLAQDSETGMVWSLADRLGSIDVLVNEHGLIVDQRTYDSFGNTLSQLDPTVKFRFGYTGRESDPETGLYYYRARYFDANVGRFISTDPIGFEAGDSNLYRYVNNSSTLATDPTGEFAEWFDNAAYTADKFLAGFAHTLTGGKSTELRNALYGDTVAGQHEGFAFDVGRSVGLATGLVTIGLATGGVGTFSGGLDTGFQLLQNGGDFSKINLASVAISAISGKVGSSVSSGLGKGGFLVAGTSAAEKGLGLAARTAINAGVGFNLGYWGKVGQNAATGEELTKDTWQAGAFGAIGAAAGELIPAGISKLRGNSSSEIKSVATDFIESNPWSEKNRAGIGRLGGDRVSRREFDELGEYLKENGIALNRKGNKAIKQLGGGNNRGAFHIDENGNPSVILTKGATKFELFHELQHAQQFIGLNNNFTAYRALGTYNREAYVFNEIWKNRKQFNKQEIEDAIRYIRKLRLQHKGF
jgi:RHS repeat-associated protein